MCKLDVAINHFLSKSSIAKCGLLKNLLTVYGCFFFLLLLCKQIPLVRRHFRFCDYFVILPLPGEQKYTVVINMIIYVVA